MTGSFSYDRKQWTSPQGRRHHLFGTYETKREADFVARTLNNARFRAKTIENQSGRYAENWDVFVYPEVPRGEYWDKYRRRPVDIERLRRAR